MNTYLALFAIFPILVFIIGLIILLRNSKSLVNKSFFMICLFGSLWSLAFSGTFYFFIQSPIEANLPVLDVLNRLSFFFGTYVMLSFVSFTFFYPRLKARTTLNYYIFLSIIVSVLSLTPFISGTAQIENGQYVFSTGSWIVLYFAYHLIGIICILINLFYHYSSSSRIEKEQIKLIFISFSASILVGLVMSVVLPVLFPESKLDIMSPISTLFFIVPVAAAITKNRLFDLRLIVARSLGYVLSIGLIIITSSFILFGLSNAFKELGVSKVLETWVYVIITILLAIAYQPLKIRFDKLTKKIFYRDFYDTQVFLNEFNVAIVSEIEINQLLAKATAVIETYLKPEFVAFAISGQDNKKFRIITKYDLGTEFFTEVDKVHNFLLHSRKKVINVDQLNSSSSSLESNLQKAKVGIVSRVSISTKGEANSGFMLLGYKKTGNIYTSQDIGAVEIISNELAIAIQNSLRFEEIEMFNITLQKRIDDATKKLRKANQRLIELDQTKDDFISMASHQLRTPLTSVKGYISMVMEGDAGKVSKKQNELLDQAFVSAQRMVYLIADLLNVSRLRTGKFIIEPKDTNLADVIEGEISQLKETAKGRNLELSYEKPSAFPHLMLDETKIRQVIMNFADNAIYYTPAGGHIQVALEDKGDSIEFTVSDDGIGVPKAEQHHLFNKFYRANNAKKARPDGTGLGLFMAKKVVVAQGGSIIFKSLEGKGSTFGFSFAKKQLLPENYKGVVKEPEKMLS